MSLQAPDLLSMTTAGSGPAVVLIHGTGADAESNWGPLIATLSTSYTVFAPNLPGARVPPHRRRGGSSCPRSPTK